MVDYTERLIRGLANDESKPEFVQVSGRRGRRAAYLGVRLNYEADDRGPKIEEAPEDAPAAEAGLQAGDVILTMDGEEIGDASELTAFLRSHRPGDEIEVNYMRGDDEATATVELTRTPRSVRRARQAEEEANKAEKSEEESKSSEKSGG